MLELLEFTFQSFWHFLGVIFLIATIGTLIPNININRYTNKKSKNE
jgi:hypothetical protein